MQQVQTETMEFSIVPNNPQVRFQTMVFSFPLVVFWVLVLSSLATGTVGWQFALVWSGILALAWFYIGWWNPQGYGRGSAIIQTAQLVVWTRSWTLNVNWSDVADVALTSFAEHGGVPLWLRITRWTEDRPCVEITMNRGLRQGWFGARYGTRIKGPLMAGASVSLYLEDPEAFVRAAESHREAWLLEHGPHEYPKGPTYTLSDVLRSEDE